MAKYKFIYIALKKIISDSEFCEMHQKIKLFKLKKHELEMQKIKLEINIRVYKEYIQQMNIIESQIEECEYEISKLKQELDEKKMDILKQDLEESLNFLSDEGWEVVQIPEGLISLKQFDGYVLCRKEEK